jgi:hypothetical protein
MSAYFYRRERMSDQIKEHDVRTIMNSMHIEGFMVTAQQARAALQAYYDHQGPQKLEALIKRMEEPGADPLALAREHSILMAGLASGE